MKECSEVVGLAMRRLSSALFRLSPDDLNKLVDPSYDLEIRIIRRRVKDESGSSSVADVSSVVEKLTGFSSREDAASFLDSNYSSKKPLEQIARFLDIAVTKKDRVDGLRDKIIEGTTGARIRSEAIKGSE